jgi:hypothetical protein
MMMKALQGKEYRDDKVGDLIATVPETGLVPCSSEAYRQMEIMFFKQQFLIQFNYIPSFARKQSCKI